VVEATAPLAITAVLTRRTAQMKVARKIEKSSKQGNTAGLILDEATFNRLSIVLQQIDGMAELIFERLQNEIEKDNAAITAYDVIREKAKEAYEISESNFGALSAARLSEVVKNARDPFSDAANPDYPFYGVYPLKAKS
jgi:hypothetical protein